MLHNQYGTNVIFNRLYIAYWHPQSKRQLEFFGHINRAEGKYKQVLSGKICGTKRRGRQRTHSRIFVTRKESPNNGRTDDREDWRAMVADVCNRPGK